ncbi:MAG: AtpZ/AtpI family protein [Eubacteriales bacterium]
MKYEKKVYHSLALITQFGINMLVPIFLCSFLGMYIDRKLETGCFMIILFFVGSLAGFRNILVFAKKIYQEDGDVRQRDYKKHKRE